MPQDQDCQQIERVLRDHLRKIAVKRWDALYTKVIEDAAQCPILSKLWIGIAPLVHGSSNNPAHLPNGSWWETDPRFKNLREIRTKWIEGEVNRILRKHSELMLKPKWIEALEEL